MFPWTTQVTKLKARVHELEKALMLCGAIALGNAGYHKLPSKSKIAPRQLLQTNKQKKAPRSRTKRFVISTLFLRECYPFLMQDEYEAASYVSGPRIRGQQVLDQLVTFEQAQRELGYARGEVISSTAALLSLDYRGFCLTGTIHSHPGFGEAAAEPSIIDRNLHQRLEKAGYQALGIIMTRDGYVRFYTAQMRFTIEVVGKDIKKLGDNSYRLILNYKPNDRQQEEQNVCTQK